MKLCLTCGEFHAKGLDCPKCLGPLVGDTPARRRARVERLVRRRLEAAFERWAEAGLVRMEDRPAFELHLDALEHEARLRDARPQAPKVPVPVDAPPAREEPAPTVSAPEVVQAVLEPASAGPLTGTVDAFAALDSPGVLLDPEEPPAPSRWETELRPLLYENIGWFLGTLFVLAGSVYGVREAWRTLGGVPRHLLVVVAFALYHAAFAGLGRLLAPRSAATGKVLGGISLGLLPVVFTALGALAEVSVFVALVATTATAVLARWTLAGVAQRFALEGREVLTVALLPSLLAHVPAVAAGQAPTVRLALPFLGLGVLGLATRSAALAPIAAALYGASTLAALAYLGTPGSSDAGPLSLAVAGLWASGLAALTVERSAEGPLRDRLPRTTSALEVLALALLAGLSLAAAWRVLGAPSDAPTALLALAQAALSAWVFARSTRRHPGALHAVVPTLALATSLAARCLVPRWPAAWALGGAVAVAAILCAAARLPHGRPRAVLLGWSRGGALAALFCTMLLAQGATLPGRLPTFGVAASMLLALAAHTSGALGASMSHYVGGLCLAVVAAWPSLFPGRATDAMAALTALYGLWGVLAAPRSRPEEAPLRPLEDLSLLAGILGLTAALWERSLPSPAVSPEGPWWRTLDLPVVALGALLMLRSLRDGSRLVALLGALALGAAAALAPYPVTVGERAFCLALVAVAFTAVAGLQGSRTRETDAPGRSLFGALSLPWRAGPWTQLMDGLAMAGVVALAGAVALVAVWLSTLTEPDRPFAIGASVGVIVVGLLAFATRALELASLRGHVGALAAAGVGVALAGLTNRLGRPLPPAVVGVKLSVVTLGVWLLARLLVALGPRLAAKLGNDDQGALYHYVPHAGVLALGTLLGVDGALILAPDLGRGLAVTPPTLYLGAALAFVLLGRSAKNPWWWAPATLGLLLGATHLASTRTLRGPELVRVSTGAWVPAEAVPPEALWYAKPAWLDPSVWLGAGDSTVALCDRAALGLASGAAVLGLLAVLSARSAGVNGLLTRCLGAPETEPGPVLREQWATGVLGAASALTLGSWWRASAPAAAVLVAAAALVVGARTRARGVLTAALALVTLAQAFAFASGTAPWWVGPGLALVALLVVLSGPLLASRYGVPLARVSGRTHALGLFLGATGGLYALATGAPAGTLPWGAALLQGAATALLGRWLESPAIPITAAWMALVFAFIARQRASEEGGRISALLACLAAGKASSTGVLVLFSVGAPRALVPSAGTPVALALALTAAGAHAASRRTLQEGPTRGVRLGRDLLLLSSGVWVGIFVLAVQGPVRPDPHALTYGVLALAAVVGVSLHAAWREASARHVDLVQGSVVGVYALVRAVFARDLPPEFDAVCVLGLGFALVGVTVQARKAGLEPVARATRRFAALLPLALWVVLPSEVSGSSALAAAGAGVLYGVLGAVEKSRLFGALGAAAVNLALILAGLSTGFQGVEVYLGPVGLFVGCLGQLLAPSLAVPARNALRIVGGLLVYLPSGWQLALQVGNARDGWYPVGFGVVCLAGIAAGMLLHLRAYLALGLVFLVLDVVASLVYAGLRDHRLGFLVLSLAGLGILGVMVLTTVKRDAYRALVARVRAQLGRWE
ncbi:MAG: hypothetical protein HY909_11705 [Deltaproteobacteria bacterium]|nr:hypothetical protein [Deltaproteobacteria bacterium]